VVDRLADQRRRPRHVALRQADEGQAGVRAPHVLVGGTVRLLGPRDVALAEPDVAQLGERPAELAAHPRAEVVAGAQRLVLRRRARARHPQDLGPVDAAPAVEPTEGGAVPPPVHGFRPLAGHVVEGQALRGADQLAQHHPAGEGVDRARHEQGTDLVELLEALGDPALQDRDAGAGRAADDLGGGGGQAPAERDGQVGLPASRGHVAAHEALVGADGGDDGVDRALVVALEQALGPAQPAPDGGHQAGVDHQEHGDHGGRPGGAGQVVGLAQDAVLGLPRGDRRLEVAVAVGRPGPQLEHRR
jgi:hypothetical protein